MGRQWTVQHEEDRTLPTGIDYTGRLDEISYRTMNWTDKKTGQARSKEMASFIFTVNSPDQYAGRKARGEVEAIMGDSQYNAFRAWYEALLGGVSLSPEDNLDDDMIIGQPARFTIRHEKDRNDPLKVWAKVEQVLPAAQQSSGYADAAPPF